MKDESKAVKETMIRLNAEIDSLSKTLNKTQNELDYLSQMIKQDSENKIGDLEDKINKFHKRITLIATRKREARADEAHDLCWLVVRTARNKRHGASRDEPFHACFEFARAFFKQQDGNDNNNNNDNNNKDLFRRR
jgi:chromosome segregation ATPase